MIWAEGEDNIQNELKETGPDDAYSSGQGPRAASF